MMKKENKILAFLLNYTLNGICHGNKNQLARLLSYRRENIRPVIDSIYHGTRSFKMLYALIKFYFENETYSLDEIRSHYLHCADETTGSQKTECDYREYIDYMGRKAAELIDYSEEYEAAEEQYMRHLVNTYCIAAKGKPFWSACDECSFVKNGQDCPLKRLSEFVDWVVDCKQRDDQAK